MPNCFDMLPELRGTGQIIRIPAELDVPLTSRVCAIIDSPEMQRLKRISQLGLVSLVYPGAVHTRFEHCLGVYRLACQVLSHLSYVDPHAASELTESDLKIFLLASLLHDVGHWPYCHPIEDMRLPEVSSHEQAARRWITQGHLADLIEKQWGVSPECVADFLSVHASEPGLRKLQNILNGPVDIDKMDYLQRDSLHAGVPYGRNFDVARLINSVRFGEVNRMSITTKGKTAAEMMVFSRYVMFSEVYWHHSVRSATAMLQRAVYRLRSLLIEQPWHDMSDAQFQERLLSLACRVPALGELAESLFGGQRRLYKRLAQYNFAVSPKVHQELAHRPFFQLLEVAESLSRRLADKYKINIGPDDLLIDAPPVKLEVQFKLDIHTEHGLQSLAELSPVVRALATDQFDKLVKQVRIFVKPELKKSLAVSQEELTESLLAAACTLDDA